MIDSNTNYAFVDIDETEQVIHGHEVNNRNGWQGATTYYRFDGVTFEGDDFICLSTNSNVIPGTNPTLWSYLVALEGAVTPVVSTGSDYIARSMSVLAYNTAIEAYTLAQTGTNLVYTEQFSRKAGDQSNYGLIVAETGSRIASDRSESGTRSSADQFLQNQVTTQTGVNVSQQAQLDSIFAALGVSFNGTFSWWMSQIRGGLTDTRVNVINGIVSGLTESVLSWEDFEFYGTGSMGNGSFNKGTGWNGAGVLNAYPIPGTVAEEGYAGLSDGPVTSVPATSYYGWISAASVGNGTLIGFSGSDAFDYATGTVLPGGINGGFGWTTKSTIYTR